MATLIIIDDDATTLELLSRLCRKAGHMVLPFSCGEQALRAIQRENVDLLIADLHLKHSSGLVIVSRGLEVKPNLPVIMITANDTLDAAAAAMKLGVFDFLTKPFKPAHLIASVNKALAMPRQASHPCPSRWIESGDRLPSSPSSNMQKALNMIERLSPLGCPILLQGEYGVGKRGVARWIHGNSARANEPLVEVCCVRASEQTIIHCFESESVGKGSILLADVDALSTRAQAMLNHLLDEQMASRSAWSLPSPSSRIIASTSQDLEQITRAGHFREDLFYKLAVMPIRIPPLRERVEELPILVRDTLLQLSREMGWQQPPQLQADAVALLTHYNWPGNMVELRNALERACILCDGKTITAEHLPTKLGLPSAFGPKVAWASTFPVGMSLHGFLKQQEHLFILETLKYFEGARDRACSTLGISGATLYRKTGIRREKSKDFKPPITS